MMEKRKRVIKEFEDRSDDIAILNDLLSRDKLSSYIKKKIEYEIRKIRAGDFAEKNASYLLGQIVKDRDVSYLINNLRLEVNGDACQIDHIILSRYGMARLFETKSFSTGIKINDDGTFFRWDDYGKRYIEIPSPIKQSQRHELVLRKVLKSIGYDVIEIQHFVVVDYKAKLIKPQKGFENVCRPDMVEDAVSSIVDKLSSFNVLRTAVGMIKNRISDDECEEKALLIKSMHKPIVFNFAKKFGLSDVVEDLQHNQEDKVSDKPVLGKSTQSKENEDINYKKLTESKVASKLGLKTKDFNEKMIVLGYCEKRGGMTYLTDKGKRAGIEFRKGSYNYYFLYPYNFIIS
jgi:hypothetical protein